MSEVALGGGLAEQLGIQVPIFAFSHCRDVVAAASAAGGMGVLGASQFTAEELTVELDWIDAHTGGNPYAVDLVFPSTGLTDATTKLPPPQTNSVFVDELLTRYGVDRAPLSIEDRRVTYRGEVLGIYGDILDMILARPLVRVLACAMGVPPADVINRAHAADRYVAALCGAPAHAAANKIAGVDIIVAQGSEAGGHAGRLSTMVLVPQVVDAVAPLPVLAAGGIANGRQMAAALALGAAGAWCGSVWLATTETDISEAFQDKIIHAESTDAVLTTSLSGKPCRVLQSAWTDEWAASGAPNALPLPGQGQLIEDALNYIERGAQRHENGSVALLTGPAGQVIGQLDRVRGTQQVMFDMISECADVLEMLPQRFGF